MCAPEPTGEPWLTAIAACCSPGPPDWHRASAFSGHCREEGMTLPRSWREAAEFTVLCIYFRQCELAAWREPFPVLSPPSVEEGQSPRASSSEAAQGSKDLLLPRQFLTARVAQAISETSEACGSSFHCSTGTALWGWSFFWRGFSLSPWLCPAGCFFMEVELTSTQPADGGGRERREKF